MQITTNAPGERITGRDSAPVESALLDVDQVAALCRCSARTVYRLADSGRMPRPLKLGALVRWRREEVLNWIAGGCRPVRTTKGRQP